MDRHAPDVVLTDIRMPPSFTDEGIRVAAMLRERDPPIGVVILSSYAEPDFAFGLLESGLEGRAYILKERVSDRGQLVSAIHTVAAGGSVMDPKVVEPLVRARAREKHSALSELSARELEVLAEIAQGKSNAAVAESLFLTKRAVEKHINAIFMKLNLAFAEDISKRVKATLLFLAEFEERPRLALERRSSVSRRARRGRARRAPTAATSACGRSRCFGKHGAGAAAQRLGRQVVDRVGADERDEDARAGLDDPARRHDAADARHVHVEEHEVRAAGAPRARPRARPSRPRRRSRSRASR